MELNNKTVLLTGASGGIGSALAYRLALAGARLLLQGRDRHRLDRLLSGLPHIDRHRVLVADLLSPDDRRELVQQVQQLGGLDVLINNAGTSSFAWLSDQTPAAVSEQLMLNLTVPVLLTRELLPLLRRPGLIMNMGSAFGAIGYPGYSVYCAGKAGLRGFSEALGRELAGSGLEVLYFAPPGYPHRVQQPGHSRTERRPRQPHRQPGMGRRAGTHRPATPAKTPLAGLARMPAGSS